MFDAYNAIDENFFIIHSLATQRRYLTVGQSMSSCMDGKLHVFQYGTGKTHTEQVSSEYAQVYRLLAASPRRRGVTVASRLWLCMLTKMENSRFATVTS